MPVQRFANFCSGYQSIYAHRLKNSEFIRQLLNK